MDATLAPRPTGPPQVQSEEPIQSLPPSHSAWIEMNGEPNGVDPDYSIVIYCDPSEHSQSFEDAMTRVRELGATFYRWTRVDLTSGILDAWKTKPQFQGRVGYGAPIEVAGNSR